MKLHRLIHRASDALRVAIAAAAIAGVTTAFADAGHSHGEAPAAVGANGPQRQPDGSVFLPKPAQRQIGVRTQPVDIAALPQTVALNGRVVMDPNAGGRVQPLVAGRIEAGPRGLPSPGQAVKKGEVLAYVVPSTGSLERAGQQSQLAELRASRALAQKRLARLNELADTVPRKEVETAESELASLAARIGAIGAGLDTRDALVAPVSGVVASVNAVLGQVVDARELLFEIVDPARLRVEALAFDGALPAQVAGASIAVGGQHVPLRFVGASRTLRDQAVPLVFAAEAGALAQLSIGQPVRVIVQTRTPVQGAAVPSAALMKNAANQTTVWVKVAPERFEPRVVMTEPLDGAAMAVTSGLRAGDRVVTQGATLINQIR